MQQVVRAVAPYGGIAAVFVVAGAPGWGWAALGLLAGLGLGLGWRAERSFGLIAEKPPSPTLAVPPARAAARIDQAERER